MRQAEKSDLLKKNLTENEKSFYSKRLKSTGWEFTKLFTQICKIYLNFKMLLQSCYLQKKGTL